MNAVATSTPSVSKIPSFDRGLVVFFLVVATFVLSLSFRQREIGDTSIDFQNGIKLIVWTMMLLYCAIHVKDIAPLFHSPVGYALLSLAALALASSLWSDVKLYTFASALGFTAYLGLAAISTLFLNDQTFSVLVRRSLLLFILIGLIGAVMSPDLTWQEPSVEETVYRLQGFAGNANNFGRYSALLILLGLGAFKPVSITRFEFLLSFSTGALGLLLSGSRTGLLAAVGACLFVSLRYYRVSRIILFGLALLTASALLYSSYGFQFNSLLKMVSRTGLESEILTLTGRTEIWTTALDLIRERPFFGWGFNGTEARLASTMSETFGGDPVNAHQMFLQLMLGLGMIGTVPVIIAFLYRFRYALIAPYPLVDLVSGFILLNGLAEADLFATPVLTNIILFRILLSDPFRLKDYRT